MKVRSWNTKLINNRTVRGEFEFNLPASTVGKRTDFPNTEARLRYLENIITALIALIQRAPVNSRYQDWHREVKEFLNNNG